MINDVLPPELLSLILEQCHQMVVVDDYSKGSYTSQPQLVASHVCVRWREIALSTPSLWADIRIDDHTSYEQTETWLVRSKSLPLHIQVELTADRDWILGLLVEHLHRWQSVELKMRGDAPIKNVLFRLYRKSAPRLRRLALIDWSGKGYVEGIMGARFKLFNGPGSTPNLENLCFCGLGIDWTWHPFSALTDFDMTRTPYGSELSLEQFITVLQTSPLLARLAIGGTALRPTEIPTALSSDILPVTLPRLKSLILSDFGSPTILNAHLRLIHAPKLADLFLGDLNNFDEGHQLMDFASTFQLLASVQGPFPLSSLESLELSAVRCRSSEAFERFVCGLTRLRQFHLHIGEHERGMSNTGLERRYLRAFLPIGSKRERVPCPTTPNGACPALQDICLSGFGPDTIMDIVVPRIPIIKHIWIDRRDGLGTSEIARWKELGIRVDIFPDITEHRRVRAQRR